MRKFSALVVFVAVLGLTASSFAQAAGPKGGKAPTQGQARPGGPGGGGLMRMMGARGQEMREKIFAKINLTADQKSKIKKLDADMAAKFQKMFSANAPKPGAAPKNGAKPGQAPAGGRPGRMAISEKQRAEFQKMNTDYQAGLKNIMGAAKYSQYEKLMKAEREAMRKEFEKNRPAGGGAPGKKPGTKDGGGR